MTHPAYIREKAVQLRLRGMTLDDIAERLALPKTTVWYWIKDLPAPPRQSVFWSPEAIRRRAEANSRTWRLRREAAYDQGAQEFADLAQDPTFRDFVGLYLAEGFKRTRHCLAVGNSDPAIVVICARWMRRLSAGKMDYAIQYHADQDLDELAEFWSEKLGIEPSQIRLQRKSNSNQLSGRAWRSKYGVLTVRINDTYLRARMQAWMDLLRESWL